MDYFLLSLVCAVGLLHTVYSYQMFQSSIPNGKNVPDPCDASKTWGGVGHYAIGGGGPRNPFGLDFKSQGYTWTTNLCETDSDNDGKTNGEELGDPECTWTEGKTPERITDLSHPGFDEKTFNCSTTGFKCDAIDDETRSIDVRLTNTVVPSKETTYMCQVINITDLLEDGDKDKDFHIIASKAAIGNANVMHHALLYGCNDKANIDPKDMMPTECFMNRIKGCEELIAVWAIGGEGVCYQKDSGFRVGKTGYKMAVLELHWDNPMEESNYEDDSGLTIYLTPKLREFDAGMFMIGQMSLEIPPGLERYTANSTCSSECTEKIMNGSIKIVGTLNHMHSIGSAITSQMVSDDGSVIALSTEEDYDYNSPKFRVFENPIDMEPGYKLQLTCHYDSTTRDETTEYGEGTSDEMCFAFIMYYPKEKLMETECLSYGAYDTCGVITPGGNFCDFDALADPTNPDTARRNGLLFTYCQPGFCQENCVGVVRDIFEEVCFKGQNLAVIKEALRSQNDSTSRLGFIDYLYRLDSCNTELIKQQCKNWEPEEDCTLSSDSCYCDIGKVNDEIISKNSSLFEYCEPGICNGWCLALVRDMFRDPCFQGQNLEQLKEGVNSENPEIKLAYMEYFYRLESCNTELAEEKCGKWIPVVDGAVRANMASSAFIVFFTIFVSRM